MRHTIENVVLTAIQAAVDAGELALDYTPEAAVERPRDATHGDWATAVALRLARELGRSPRDIAAVIAAHIEQSASIAAVEVAGPGFINLRLSDAALQQVVRDAREQGSAYGRTDLGAGKTVNLEFVSANPTGPLHVGHGRWAALGNALANVLCHAGWEVTREFYVNDAGNQMDGFGHSVALRYLELCGVPIDKDALVYGGAYVIDIARQIRDDEQGGAFAGASADAAHACPPTANEGNPLVVGASAETPPACPPTSIQSPAELTPQHIAYFREAGYQLMLTRMQTVLKRLGISFQVWFSERSLYVKGADGLSPVDVMLEALEAGGYLYEQDGATWFRTTDFGDDKPRVLIKADGSYTYFAPDIAYHLNKFRRGSAYLVNIWGADHHGYIPRMQAACEALGHAGKLTVVLGQLVNLYRDGEAVRMSKRTGEMISFEELIEEVGADATKYLMLARSTDQPIDFDIEVAKKQDASNPVYYVQYAHARICSLLRKVGENSGLLLNTADLTLLTSPAELDLARALSQMSEVVEAAARDLAPVKLTHYAEELATAFHSFYTRCQVITEDEAITAARLYLADATRNVLALTLTLLGVTAPERM